MMASSCNLSIFTDSNGLFMKKKRRFERNAVKTVIFAALYQALAGKHPFSNFKHVVDIQNIRDEWFVFKNASDRRMAEEWLREEGLEWMDGTVTRTQE